MNSTLKWIDNLEKLAFPEAFNEPHLQKDYVYSFISKSTVMNELMQNVSDDYVRDLVDSMYTSPRMNMHRLKQFVILDYPLAVIESIFCEEHKHRVRSIKAGLYPLNSGRSINACATLSPMGENVIFFSEWLFAFLWDYFHAITDVFPLGTKPSNSTLEQQQQAQQVKKEFIEKLATGLYKNWDIKALDISDRVANSAKYDLLFSLIFIWAHELGHIILAHLDASHLNQMVFVSTNGEGSHLPTYTLEQEEEFDADMFASDIYFAYLSHGISFSDENTKRSLIARGLEFFELLARTEKEPSYFGWQNASHPPTPTRLLYICLRHKYFLTKYGWQDLFERIEQATGYKELIASYNYKKDLGVHLLLDPCYEPFFKARGF
jgi:hypothetical protein